MLANFVLPFGPLFLLNLFGVKMSRLFVPVLFSSALTTCEPEPLHYPDLELRHLSMSPETGVVDSTPFLWTAVVNNPDEAPGLSLIIYSEASDRHWREEMQLQSEDTPFLYSLELEFGQPGYYEYQLVVEVGSQREMSEVHSFWVDEADVLPVSVQPHQHENGEWTLRLPLQHFEEMPRADLLWLDPIEARLNRQSYQAGSTGDDFLFYTELQLPDPTRYLVWTELQAQGETWLSSVEVVEGPR